MAETLTMLQVRGRNGSYRQVPVVRRRPHPLGVDAPTTPQGPLPSPAPRPDLPAPQPEPNRPQPEEHNSPPPPPPGNAAELVAMIEDAIGVSEQLEELRLLRAELDHERELMRWREAEKARKAERLAQEVPDVNPAAVDAITRLLMTARDDVKKPPVKAAHLLAILCRLHELRRPLPERAALACKIGGAASTVDAVLSARTYEGFISMRVETREGNVNKAKRESVVREKYYDPAPKLFSVYRESQPH